MNKREMVLYHSEQSDVTVNAIIKDEKVVVAKIATTTQFRIWITNHNKCVKKGAKSWINSYYTQNTA